MVFSCLQEVNETQLFHPISHNLGPTFQCIPVYEPPNLNLNWNLISFQINPLFDQELDQWLFVGELRRSIYISPVGDYDFDGIDTTEFTVKKFSQPHPGHVVFLPALGNGDGIRHSRAGELLLLSRRAHGSRRRQHRKKTLKLTFLFKGFPLGPLAIDTSCYLYSSLCLQSS